MPSSEPLDGRDGPATVRVYEDGPYLIHGNYEILNHDGGPIASRRRTVALCRCGRSKLRPFCDGTHRLTRFRAPGTIETPPAGGPSGATLDGAAPDAIAETPEQTLAKVTAAHRRVRESIVDVADDPLRHAEPLLAAAEALLRWQLDAGASSADGPEARGAHRATPQEVIRAARVSAVRLSLRDPQVADQLRSLLRDAARALRETAPVASGDDR